MSSVALHPVALETPQAEAHSGHKVLRLIVWALLAYMVLPFFGVGLYQNGAGQSFFTLWYLLGFLVLGFFLMHELITPFPGAERKAG